MGSVIRKSVAFENEDIEEIEKLRKQKGLGSKGFSAALRMIIREWRKDRYSITDKGGSALRDNDKTSD